MQLSQCWTRVVMAGLMLIALCGVAAAQTERVSVASDVVQADGGSFTVADALSADGRFVAFRSWATNLVAGDTNEFPDIFVHDRQTGTTERVSVASDGTEADEESDSPTISADGRFVAFASSTTKLIIGDTNEISDVFVYNRQTGTTERISVASDGTEADGSSSNPAISADGRFVAFRSTATNLVEGDTNEQTDVFVHDRQTGTTERISVASDGTEADGSSVLNRALSADGRFVSFASNATNLGGGGHERGC